MIRLDANGGVGSLSICRGKGLELLLERVFFSHFAKTLVVCVISSFFITLIVHRLLLRFSTRQSPPGLQGKDPSETQPGDSFLAGERDITDVNIPSVSADSVHPADCAGQNVDEVEGNLESQEDVISFDSSLRKDDSGRFVTSTEISLHDFDSSSTSEKTLREGMCVNESKEILSGSPDDSREKQKYYMEHAKYALAVEARPDLLHLMYAQRNRDSVRKNELRNTRELIADFSGDGDIRVSVLLGGLWDYLIRLTDKTFQTEKGALFLRREGEMIKKECDEADLSEADFYSLDKFCRMETTSSMGRSSKKSKGRVALSGDNDVDFFHRRGDVFRKASASKIRFKSVFLGWGKNKQKIKAIAQQASQFFKLKKPGQGGMSPQGKTVEDLCDAVMQSRVSAFSDPLKVIRAAKRSLPKVGSIGLEHLSKEYKQLQKCVYQLHTTQKHHFLLLRNFLTCTFFLQKMYRENMVRYGARYAVRVTDETMELKNHMLKSTNAFFAQWVGEDVEDLLQGIILDEEVWKRLCDIMFDEETSQIESLSIGRRRSTF